MEKVLAIIPARAGSKGVKNKNMRLIEGDPLINLCPIAQTIKDPKGLESLIANLDMGNTIHMDARAYSFNIVLRGKDSTIFENKLNGN